MWTGIASIAASFPVYKILAFLKTILILVLHVPSRLVVVVLMVFFSLVRARAAMPCRSRRERRRPEDSAARSTDGRLAAAKVGSHKSSQHSAAKQDSSSSRSHGGRRSHQTPSSHSIPWCLRLVSLLIVFPFYSPLRLWPFLSRHGLPGSDERAGESTATTPINGFC
jgi:hypothetical protein